MIAWSSLLIPANVMFRIKPMLSQGPQTFSGRSQKVGTDAGYWVATLSEFPVLTPEKILEWRGIIGALQGGLEDLLIGPFDEFQAPLYRGLPPIITSIPHSDGSLFDDGSGYSQSSIIVTASESRDLRATSLSLKIQQAGELKRGMYFSAYQDGRPSMHMITQPPVISKSTAMISFLPPLRFPVLEDARIDFADPKILMNLASPDAGELNLEYGRWSRPSIDLEESWNGL